MSSNAVPLGTPLTRDGAGTLLGQTVGLVAVTTGLFAVGASLGRDLSLGWGWLGFLAAFGCLIAMHLAVQRSEGLAITLLFGFGLLIGVATAPTLRYCAGADPRRSGRPASPSSSAQIPGGAVIYAIVGLVIFAGLTAFDFQRLRRSQDIRTAPLLAASIFLDILNVFLLLLSLFGRND